MMPMNDAWGYANERHPVASWSCRFVIHIPHPSTTFASPRLPFSGTLWCFGSRRASVDLGGCSSPAAVPRSCRELQFPWKSYSSTMQIQQASVFLPGPSTLPRRPLKACWCGSQRPRGFSPNNVWKRLQLCALSFQNGQAAWKIIERQINNLGWKAGLGSPFKFLNINKKQRLISCRHSALSTASVLTFHLLEWRWGEAAALMQFNVKLHYSQTFSVFSVITLNPLTVSAEKRFSSCPLYIFYTKYFKFLHLANKRNFKMAKNVQMKSRYSFRASKINPNPGKR